MNISKKLKGFFAAAVALTAVFCANCAFAEPGAVQLWADGPYFSTCNGGATAPEEYGGHYTYSDAVGVVTNTFGSEWRMPTGNEMIDLVNNCDSVWTTRNDVPGRVFTGRGEYASKSIFLPAAGYNNNYVGEYGVYWSSGREKEKMQVLYFSTNRTDTASAQKPITPVPVRPVRDTPLPTTVTINEVKTVDPWDNTKGAITVDYTLGGLDEAFEYKVAFDITANGQTASVTNDAAKLAAGRQAVKTIDTVALFGRETIDPRANVKISLIAVKARPLGGVQLWADGPFFAECNVGAAAPEEYGIHYNYPDAVVAVTNTFGSAWRIPTGNEMSGLVDNCDSVWTTRNDVAGRVFTGKGEYASKSIFLPAAGYNNSSVGERGVYWTSTLKKEKLQALFFSSGETNPNTSQHTDALVPVRPVRDAE